MLNIKQCILLAFAIGMFFAADAVHGAPRADRRPSRRNAAAREQAQRAELVMKSLAQAYPQRITKVEYRRGDWALLLQDTWFYFAEGRLLPEEIRGNASEYSPIIFYHYPRDLPPWTEPTPEQVERFSGGGGPRPARPPRATYFFDALYQAGSREEAQELMQTIDFFGSQLTIHSAIAEIVQAVEGLILTAAGEDAEIQAWIDGIGSVYGWTWRNIPNTQSRSYHSYGVAIDILPESLEGKEMYWLWAGSGWWDISYEGRYHQPDAVIAAFESFGFVWGGKWLMFDTMHFEYRPEVFIINGLELSTLQ